jgi:hypothetical protein
VSLASSWHTVTLVSVSFCTLMAVGSWFSDLIRLQHATHLHDAYLALQVPAQPGRGGAACVSRGYLVSSKGRREGGSPGGGSDTVGWPGTGAATYDCQLILCFGFGGGGEGWLLEVSGHVDRMS